MAIGPVGGRSRAQGRDEPAYAHTALPFCSRDAPGEWLQRERLRLAQRLLESSSDPIEFVAKRAGYDSDATMRAQFATRLQTSPRAYRRTFQPSIKNVGSTATPG